MNKERHWIKILFDRLCKRKYLEESDYPLLLLFFDIKSVVSVKEIEKIYIIIKNWNKSVTETEKEMWHIKNRIYKTKNGIKIIAICFLFDLQFKEKPYVDDDEHIIKLKFVDSLIANGITRNFLSYS